MKLNHKHIWQRLVLPIAICFCLDSQAQEYSELTFCETFKNGLPSNYKAPALAKAQRVHRNACSIIATGENEIEDDEVQKVLEYVLSVWESYLLNSSNIYIKVDIDEIPSDIETTVKYRYNNNIAYPTSLIGYTNGRDEDDPVELDGIIVINRNTDWDYGIGDNINPDKKNLAFGLMRAVARILGFGSDAVADANGNYFFSEKRIHTIFNTLVSNTSGKRLSDIPVNGGRPSIELKSFIEEPNQSFSVTTSKKSYELASPPYSLQFPPFIYLKDGQSLMRKDITIGDYFLQIDEATQDILHELGWNTKTPIVEIISMDIPDTGLASAYESHGFRLKFKNDIKVSQEKWHLELPLDNHQSESISMRKSGDYWYTDPIDNINKYKLNIDGDIEAKICCTCNLNGDIVNLMPFKVKFELQPKIEYAFIERIENESPKPSYNAYYKVKYYGADQVRVYVEEEYSSAVKLSYINEPYIASGCATHIRAPFRAWIDFVVENKYGKCTSTISLLPNGEIESQTINKANEPRDRIETADTKRLDEYVDQLQVYDVCGNKITEISSFSELDDIPYKGLVIISNMGKDGETRTFKTILK